MKPLCFVLMPLDVKPRGSGDFNAVYSSVILPAIEKAGMTPLRAGEERTSGIIHQGMFERLVLCEYAVVDLTTADANVFYELGVRHAVRPGRTVAIYAKDGRPPFDAARMRAIGYDLGADGKITNGEVVTAKVTEMLVAAKKEGLDSPAFTLVERMGVPDIKRLKTDVFRDRVDYCNETKERLAEARQKGPEAVREIDRSLGAIDGAESGVVIDLLLSYRAVRAWEDMVELAGRMSKPLARTVMVREQLGLALNRLGRSEEAEKVLLEVIREHGPSSETHALLGRVYKDRWDEARRAGEPKAAVAAKLEKAIETYVKGFEADWRDAFPGVNAVTLMEFTEPRDARQARMIPVVAYAVERRIAAGKPDYWDFAATIELAVLARDRGRAKEASGGAVANTRERWEPESTARTLKLIRESME